MIAVSAKLLDVQCDVKPMQFPLRLITPKFKFVKAEARTAAVLRAASPPPLAYALSRLLFLCAASPPPLPSHFAQRASGWPSAHCAPLLRLLRLASLLRSFAASFAASAASAGFALLRTSAVRASECSRSKIEITFVVLAFTFVVLAFTFVAWPVRYNGCKFDMFASVTC